MEIFPFQNNHKNLDPFYKMDLDFGIVKQGKTCIIAKFYMTDLAFCSHSREKKTLYIAK